MLGFLLCHSITATHMRPQLRHQKHVFPLLYNALLPFNAYIHHTHVIHHARYDVSITRKISIVQGVPSLQRISITYTTRKVSGFLAFVLMLVASEHTNSDGVDPEKCAHPDAAFCVSER